MQPLVTIKIFGGNFPKRKKSAAELCQKIRIVTIETVINYTRVMCIRVTISSRHCIALEAMLLFLVCLFVCLFVGHALSPEHPAFEGRIVRTSIALPFIARFRRGFQRFSEGIAILAELHSYHFSR